MFPEAGNNQIRPFQGASEATTNNSSGSGPVGHADPCASPAVARARAPLPRDTTLAVDFAWPALKVAAEVEGGIWTGGRHVRGKGYESDCMKYSVAALAGWIVIRATPGMVHDGDAVLLVAAALVDRQQANVSTTEGTE